MSGGERTLHRELRPSALVLSTLQDWQIQTKFTDIGLFPIFANLTCCWFQGPNFLGIAPINQSTQIITNRVERLLLSTLTHRACVYELAYPWDGVEDRCEIRERLAGKTWKRRRGWSCEGTIPVLPGSEGKRVSLVTVLGITNGPKNRQRVKGPGVPGGDAGAGATGGCAAGLPAAGLPAGLFPVLASPRSGLDTSVPGTKVWR